MELLELLCFIVLLKSVDIMPTEIVELLALPTPVTWIVPDGCKAASMPFCLTWGEPSECFVATFFFMTPFCTKFWFAGLLRAIMPPVSPCGWYYVCSYIFCYCWCWWIACKLFLLR